MKKFLKVVCFSLALLSASFTPPKAQAVVAIIKASVVTAAIGATVLVAGPAVGAGIMLKGTLDSMGSGAAVVTIVAGAVLFAAAPIVGVVILDEKNPSSIRYNAINEEQAKKLNLSESQVSIYNSELNELNSVLESSLRDFSKKFSNRKIENKTEALKLLADSIEFAELAWKKIEKSAVLSVETMQVVNSIRSQK